MAMRATALVMTALIIIETHKAAERQLRSERTAVMRARADKNLLISLIG